MNGKKLRFSALFVAALLIGLANSSNPPNGRTGAPGDTFCTDCHGNPSSSIDGLIDISGVPNSIDPNTTYTLTVTSEFTSGAPTRAGFQMVVLDSNNDDSGSLSNPSASSTITPSGGRTYFEHSPSINFNGNTSVSWEVDWTSPAGPDMEDITFYASTILANGNGNTSSDRMKLTNVTGTLDAAALALEIEIIEQEDISCFGLNDGYALVEVTGGVAPYSFDWDNGETSNPAISLNPGSNVLTVTDDLGETETITVDIFEPSQIIIDSEVIDISCFDLSNGMILTIVSGGTGNYLYDWSNGATGAEIFDLPAGPYFVTVSDENDCQEISSFNISEPPPITISSVDINDATCTVLGSININSQGGTGILTATWSNGDIGNSISNLDAGSYMVTVTDENNCAITQQYEVSGPEDLDYSSDFENIDCNGANNGSIELFFNSSSDYTAISWSNGSTNEAIFDLVMGNYSVTIEDNFNCLYEESFFIEEPALIEITSSIINDVSCNSLGSIEITTTGGTGNLFIDWSTGETGNIITGLSAGNYSVEILDDNSCGIFQSFTIEQIDGITYQTNVINPTCNGFNNGSIDLIFNSPTDYSSILWSTGETTTQLSNVGSGAYSVTIQDTDFCEYIETFTLTEPDILQLSATSNNQILCFGDVIDSLFLTPVGGTPPYSFFNGTIPSEEVITNLPAGNYEFNIVDINGCVDTLFLNTPNPAALSATVTTTGTTDATTADGTATINMSGGTPPYVANGISFSDSQLFSGLAIGTYQFDITDSNNCNTIVSFSISDSTIPCDDLQVTLNFTQPSCIGDEPIFDVNITGGTPPYATMWQPQNFYQGDYIISFVDANNCSVSQTVTINYTDIEPPILSLTDITVALDQGGNLESLNFDAGTTDNCGGPVTFEFLDPVPDCVSYFGPTIIGVSASDELGNSVVGTFMLTITDSIAPTIFCLDDTTISSCIDFTIPDPIVTDNCSGVSLTTLQSEDLSIGINEIIYVAEDAFGNSDTCVVLITVDVDIVYEIDIVNPACAGESNGFYEVTSLNPSTIIYENGLVQDLNAGVYYFSIVDDTSGCMVSDSVILSDPEPLVVSNEIIFPLSAGGNSDGAIEITIQGGTIPYTYTWLDEQGNVVSEDASANNLIEGIYFCNITDGNGCILQTENYSISFESSIAENYLKQVEIYPNPFNKNIYIESPSSLDKVNIYNAQGKLVLALENPDSSVNLDLLDSGLYMIEICKSGQKVLKRIIKQ